MTESRAQGSVTERSHVGFTLVRLGAAGLLLVAVGKNPYDSYTIMRWIVCGVCGYVALVEFGRNRSMWAWLFVVIAVAARFWKLPGTISGTVPGFSAQPASREFESFIRQASLHLQSAQWRP